MVSPYEGLRPQDWAHRTRELIDDHPLEEGELLEVVQQSWNAIFESRLGSFRIGVHLFPKPQIMGFFLHELIPLEIAKRYPDHWRREESAQDKDLVYSPDASYSIEIKTSSSKNKIFGNRSYAQKGMQGKKSKTGYYLAVNFEKFARQTVDRPELRLVRFGWIDHDDWIGQAAPTGQQARLSPEVEAGKLLVLLG